MSTVANKISALDIIFYLRDRLLQAREQNDLNILADLQKACILLSDLAYAKEVGALGAILEDFESSARDSIMGVPWKSTIPSEEEIRLALQGKTG
jgi:hypothetical protein